MERRQAELVSQMGVDKKAFRKGHSYLTLVNDLIRERVLYVAEDRKEFAEMRDGELNNARVWALMAGQVGIAIAQPFVVNGVSKLHGLVSRGMFGGLWPLFDADERPITSITNGVHATTWASAPFADLYDRALPEWRRDNCYLRYAIDIPLAVIRQTHLEAKKELLNHVRWLTGVQLDERVFTLGFARRATAYKRGDLFFTDRERLKQIARQVGPMQLIYAGKAHPRDEGRDEAAPRGEPREDRGEHRPEGVDRRAEVEDEDPCPDDLVGGVSGHHVLELAEVEQLLRRRLEDVVEPGALHREAAGSERLVQANRAARAPFGEGRHG